MLINATQPEELRVALVDGQRLYDLDIESTRREQKKSNIYKCKIVRVEQSLEAAFVDYGSERHGFLPFKEISYTLFDKKSDNGKGKLSVKDNLQVGQEFIVQVEKEERGNKGAALTTFVSLAGRYLVLMPNNPRAGGVSRQIEGVDRSEAREAMSSLEVPQGMGFILRTAGVGKSTEELQWDLDYLLRLWDAISKSALEITPPYLIYQESDVVIRAIRDYLRKDISEIWVDDPEVYRRAEAFMQQVMQENLSKLKLYKEVDPLFNRYQIEGQIESAFSREVKLPSGGSLSIDHTEAMISIDINSARATSGEDIEETAFNTNLEASDEVARQLRLRDLGGLIVIDFIDMMNNRHQRDVEIRLKEALKIDRARVQVGRISRFGLLEMSRQRLRPSLGESSHLPCPRCSGQGSIRSVDSLALSILRIIEEEAIKEMTGKVVARLPVETATFLLNEKRQGILDIEERVDVQIVIIPNPDMETPHYQVQRLRLSDAEFDASKKASYLLKEEETKQESEDTVSSTSRVKEVPAIKQLEHSQPLPARNRPGLFSRLFSALFGSSQDSGKDKKSTENKDSRSRRPHRNASDQQKGAKQRRGSAGSSDRSSRNDSGQGRQRRGSRRQGQSQRSNQQNQKGGQSAAQKNRNPKSPQEESKNSQGKAQKSRQKDQNRTSAKPRSRGASKAADKNREIQAGSEAVEMGDTPMNQAAVSDPANQERVHGGHTPESQPADTEMNVMKSNGAQNDPVQADSSLPDNKAAADTVKPDMPTAVQDTLETIDNSDSNTVSEHPKEGSADNNVVGSRETPKSHNNPSDSARTESDDDAQSDGQEFFIPQENIHQQREHNAGIQDSPQADQIQKQNLQTAPVEERVTAEDDSARAEESGQEKIDSS
jgi:ribonuclease E